MNAIGAWWVSDQNDLLHHYLFHWRYISRCPCLLNVISVAKDLRLTKFINQNMLFYCSLCEEHWDQAFLPLSSLSLGTLNILSRQSSHEKTGFQVVCSHIEGSTTGKGQQEQETWCSISISISDCPLALYMLWILTTLFALFLSLNSRWLIPLSQKHKNPNWWRVVSKGNQSPPYNNCVLSHRF